MATDGERALRAALDGYGLGHRADRILAAGLPSIRLRGPAFEGAPAKSYRGPAPVEGLDGEAVAVATGGTHQLVLLADGTVMAWGDNSRGQLGDGTRADRRRPVRVVGVTGVAAIAAGGGSSVALLENGSVVAWGSNMLGQLGGGPGPDRLTAQPVEGLQGGVVAVSIGRQLRAVKADGSAWVVGLRGGDAGGVDGVPTLPVSVVTPPAGLRPGSWVEGLAATLDGSVVAWPGYTVGSIPPEPIPGVAGVVELAGSREFAVARRHDGSVVTWHPVRSQLGDGPTSMSVQPVLPAPATAVAAGASCGFALLTDGSLWAWGWGYDGRLGTGTDQDQPAPVAVPSLEAGVSAVQPGLALKVDGTVLTWGGEVPPEDRGLDDVLPVGATKLGGRPDLPPGTAWPAHEARPLAFLAQIRLADVAPFDDGGMLPRDGLLSFFFDFLYDPVGSLAWAVLHAPEEAPLVRTELPEGVPDRWRAPAVAVVPEADATLHPRAPGFLDHAEEDRYYRLYYDGFDPGHRMLGHAFLIQNTPEPGAQILLLQLDFDDQVAFPHEIGLLYYLISEQDLRARRFDRVFVDYECT